MRIGGGQEIGMACDFTVAQDLARFGQAGPKHGSAPIGGATDFLSKPILIGIFPDSDAAERYRAFLAAEEPELPEEEPSGFATALRPVIMGRTRLSRCTRR